MHRKAEKQALPPPQERRAGGFVYTLTPKKVKNLNLRITPDGRVALSAPPGVSPEQADAFVAAKQGWIAGALAARDARLARQAAEPVLPREECLALLTAATRRMLPLVARYVPAMPRIEVRAMKSRWGVCHLTDRRIVYATRLAAQPPPLQDYVALHELVHFAYPNHGRGFHREMARLMPDYLQRRRLLQKGASPKTPGPDGPEKESEA